MLSHVWNDCIYLKLFSSAFLHSPTHVSSPTSCILLVSHTVSESIINAYTPLVCINVPTNRLKPAHLPKHLASLPPHPHPQGRLKLQKRSISVLQWVCLFQIIKEDEFRLDMNSDYQARHEFACRLIKNQFLQSGLPVVNFYQHSGITHWVGAYNP